MTHRNDEFRRDNPSGFGEGGRKNPPYQQQNQQTGQRFQGQQQDLQGQQSARYAQGYGGIGDYENYGAPASGSGYQGGYEQERYQAGSSEGGQRLGEQWRGEQSLGSQFTDRPHYDEQGRYAAGDYSQRTAGNVAGGYRQPQWMGGQTPGTRDFGQGYGASTGYGQGGYGQGLGYGYGQGPGGQALGGAGFAYQGGFRDEGEMSGYRAPMPYATSHVGNRMAGTRHGYRGLGPRNYTRSDTRILEDVNERLTDDDAIDASEIEVKCVNGVVTLEGTVEERWMKHRVEDIVDACSGVLEVENRLTVDTGALRREPTSRLDTAATRATTVQSTQGRGTTQAGKPGSTTGPAH
jgi:hypothetical protein